MFVLLLIHLRNQWQENPPPLDDASLPLLIGALATTAGSAVLILLPWAQVVRALGTSPPRGLLSASLVGQMGKYVPGGIWPLVGRVGLAARLGVPLRTASAGLAGEMTMVVASSLVIVPFALLVGPTPMIAALAISAAVVAGGLLVTRTGGAHRLVRAVLRRAAGGHAVQVELRPLRRAMAIYLTGWIITCLAFWLTARALFGTPVADLPLLSGVYVLAWVIGFLVVIAPGGLGIREVVLVALLRPSMGESEALLLAATSRIAFTSADLILAAVGLPVLRHRLRSSPWRRGAVV